MTDKTSHISIDTRSAVSSCDTVYASRTLWTSSTSYTVNTCCPYGKPSDPLFRNQALNPPDMSAFEGVMKDRENMPMDEWLKRLEKVMLQQSPDEPYKKKEMAGGSLAVGFIDRIVPVKELIDTIVVDTEEILLNEIPNQFPSINHSK